MKKIIIFLIFSISGLFSIVAAPPAEFSGKITYRASAPTGSWEGTNSALSGDLRLDPIKGSVCVSMKEWDSNNTRRDNHAKEMFAVDRFPRACFYPAKIDGGSVSGEMEIHGVKKPVMIKGELTETDNGFQFQGTTDLKIEDFGMTRPSIMGMKVNNTVQVEILLRVSAL